MSEEKVNMADQLDETNEVLHDTEQAQENAAEAAEATVEEKLETAEQEITRLNDQLLRLRAEFDNYRKRTLKEKAELILNGGEKVMSSLLPVLDDLDRAMENIDKSDNVETLKEGVDLIISKLTKVLNGQGLQKMDVIGQPFDTDFHEAIALVPVTEEAQKNQIIDCVTSGYILNEKVIRHAKVVVGQ